MESSSDNSIRELNDAIQTSPTDWTLYINRGGVHAELEQYQQAIQDYGEAIRLAGENSPGLAGAFANRGFCYAETEQYEPAIADYQKAIQLNPNDRQTYVNLGLAYQATGQDDLAKQALDRASAPRSWGWTLSTYLPGALFFAFLSAMIGGGWFWLATAAWSDVFKIGGLLAVAAALAYAMVWLIDTYLRVWDDDGKMVGTGLSGIVAGLFALIIIFEIIMGIFFRDQVPDLFNIVDWFCEEMWSCSVN